MTSFSTASNLASQGISGGRIVPLSPGVTQNAARIVLPSLPFGRFVGRSRDLAFVLSTVKQRSTQLLTILGAGGTGKTRLAITAAWELSPLFPDGAFFIPFTATDAESVWELIAHQLSVPNVSGDPWPITLREALRRRHILLVLDNCEQVLEGLSELPEILSACPDVMVIATSQEALRVRGEQEFWLQPLVLPGNDADITAKVVDDSSAVELFELRASRVNPGFKVTDANAADVAAIVRMLDGLPLAIELAAAQTRHLSPSSLRQRLEKALPSLSGGSRDLPERQQSLMNMAAWSLSLLRPEERDQFLQLAVFVGDFTPESVAAVVEGLSPFDGWDVLLSFADKSLIKRVAGEDGSSPRFFMLQTVHAVTLHLLQQRPDLYLGACMRHARVYLDLAREAEQHWHDAEQLSWLQRMEKEHANIQAVIERALEDPRLVQVALELTEPMFWFWYTRGYHTWALPRIEQLLGVAPADIPPYVRGSAHVTAGWLAFKCRQVDRAERHFGQGTRLIPDPSSPLALRGTIGAAYVISFEGKNNVEAISQLRQVVERATDNPTTSHELAAGYFGIGLTEYFERRIPAARDGFEASLKVSRAYDDRQSIAMNLIYLAHIDRMEGRPHDAVRKLQEVLPLFLEVGDQANIVLSLDVVTSTLVELGEYELGLRIAIAVDETRRATGMVRPPLEQPDYEDAIRRIRERMKLDADQPLESEQQPIPLGDAIEQFLQFQPPPDATASTGEPGRRKPDDVLSSREIEILRLIASGKTSSEIAAELYVSPHTVKRHMANIREKLGVRSQAAAVAALKQRR